MKWLKPILLALLFMVLPAQVQAASGKIIKVLPHLLDEKGRHTLSPSLYERDAYQAKLREHKDMVSTIRFDVNWKASSVDRDNVRVRVEMRGDKSGPPSVYELKARPGVLFSTWSGLTVPREMYAELKEISAWRVTVWNGDEQIAEQKSFLW
jgi:hypothetical protein